MSRATLSISSANRFRKSITLPSRKLKYLKKTSTPRHTTSVSTSQNFFTLFFSVLAMSSPATYDTTVVPSIRNTSHTFQLIYA